MKLIEELIYHFIYSGELNEDDMAYLRAHGFLDSQYIAEEQGWDTKVEEREGWCINEDESYKDSYTDADIFADYLSGLSTNAKKGKGGQPKPRAKRLSIKEMNKILLRAIPYYEEDLSAALHCLSKKDLYFSESQKYKSAITKIRNQLFAPIDWEAIDIQSRIDRAISQKHYFFKDLAKALFSRDYFDCFSRLLKDLSVHNLNLVYSWVIGEKEMEVTPDTKTFLWVRQVRQLQKMVLNHWYEKHPSFLKEHAFHLDYQEQIMDNLGRDKFSRGYPSCVAITVAFILLEQLATKEETDPVESVNFFFDETSLSFVEQFILFLQPNAFLKISKILENRTSKDNKQQFLSSVHERFQGIILPKWFATLSENNNDKLYYIKGKLRIFGGANFFGKEFWRKESRYSQGKKIKMLKEYPEIFEDCHFFRIDQDLYIYKKGFRPVLIKGIYSWAVRSDYNIVFNGNSYYNKRVTPWDTFVENVFIKI